MVSLFSIPAFFIVLREVLEACLVVGIALAYFNRTGNTHYNKWVWLGAAAGILVSLIVGITFAVIYFSRGEQLFEGKAELIFEGIAFLVAAALLSWMIIWMFYMGKELRTNMENRLDALVEDEKRSPARRKIAVFAMIFVQVLREGIETFIFLFGSASADEQGGWRAIPIPGILAIIVGIIGSFLVFKGLVSLDIQRFFDISSFILIAFAAGLVSHGFHELQEVDWFGPWEVEVRDWYNTAMWSTKTCCHDSENQFFAMLRALFGYQDTPTFIEWVTYFAYWLIIVSVYFAINWSSVLANRSQTLARAQFLAAWSLLFTFVGFIYVMINNDTWVGVLTMTIAFILSILSVAFLYEPIVKITKSLMPLRRNILMCVGLAWVIATLLILVLHLIQLVCEGENENGCSNTFFFFGIILDSDFRELGRQVDGDKVWWPSIAVLSVSLAISLFFFGGLSFRVLLASYNVDTEGHYMDDDYVGGKNIEEDDDDIRKQNLEFGGRPVDLEQGPESTNTTFSTAKV